MLATNPFLVVNNWYSLYGNTACYLRYNNGTQGNSFGFIATFLDKVLIVKADISSYDHSIAVFKQPDQ